MIKKCKITHIINPPIYGVVNKPIREGHIVDLNCGQILTCLGLSTVDEILPTGAIVRLNKDNYKTDNSGVTKEITIKDSINIKDLTSENYSQYLISIEEALNHYERININHKYAKLLVNGVRVGDTRYTNDKVENEKLYRVYDGEKFLGLGSKNDKGFKITKLLIT